MKKIIAFSIAVFLLTGLSTYGKHPVEKVADISEAEKWSDKMALSIMHRNPEPWMIDFMDRPVWSYPQGLVLTAFERLWNKTENELYFNYIEEYADGMIQGDGTIETYKIETFNIDMINAGKILFNLLEVTGNEKYQTAIDRLVYQLKWQPRNKQGGFWHKQRYPWQMLLDGAYMGCPFMARYGILYEEEKWVNEAVNQLAMMERNMRDDKTGLLYHGWDQSRVQKWADPETGLSANFWGRAMGWYGMALVDVIEFLPDDHQGRDVLVGILNRFARAIVDVQDSETGVWYQVLDQPGREGNYLESSVSCMFVYTLARGANMGVLDEAYLTVARESFEGVLDEFIEEDDNGYIHLENVCAVAGLGGSGNRDGSFEYYINEPQRTNDPKGTGPFIKAALELNL